jgi:hypothetical protein
VLESPRRALCEEPQAASVAREGTVPRPEGHSESLFITKKKCMPHGRLRWRPMGPVNAAWVPHGDRTQRLKPLERLERQRNVMWVQNTLNGGRTHISRGQTMMCSERHARAIYTTDKRKNLKYKSQDRISNSQKIPSQLRR